MHFTIAMYPMVFGVYMLAIFTGVARVHYIGTCMRLRKGLTIKQWIFKHYDD